MEEGLKNRGLNRFKDIDKKSSSGISLAETVRKYLQRNYWRSGSIRVKM